MKSDKIINYEKLGLRIRKYRKERKWTLLYLSELISVSESFLGQCERGKNRPSLETLAKIAEVFDVSMDALLFGSLSPNISSDYFLSDVQRKTKNFTSIQKEVVLESILLIEKL